MMKYQDCSVKDFLIDENFKDWVLFPTEESNSYWNALIEAHPSLREKVQISREILLSIEPQHVIQRCSEEEKGEIFENILTSNRSIRTEQKQSRINFNLFYRIAATILLAACISYYFVTTEFPGFEESVTSIKIIEKENPKGRSSTIKLPDGTIVKLAANSKLSFPSVFSDSKREVWLEGKAFLDVSENAEKPFYVHTGEFYTKVLGTSFNIESPQDGKLLNVVLVTGKVLVEDSSGVVSELLSPNQKLSVDREHTIITKSPLDYNKDLAWKDGILVLDKESVKTLKQKLESWYGIEVSLSGITDDHQFTGKFKNKSLEYVMDAIAYASAIEYTLDEKTLVLKTKNNVNDK